MVMLKECINKLQQLEWKEEEKERDHVADGETWL